VLQLKELNTMAKELEKDPAELPNTEFKSFTSQGLPRERKDNEAPYFDDLGQCEAFYNDELGIFPDINDEEVTNKYHVFIFLIDEPIDSNFFFLSLQVSYFFSIFYVVW